MLRPPNSCLCLLPILAAVLTAGCGGGSEDQGVPAEPTRLVLITLDTLRADALQVPEKGGAMDELRRFAEGGLVFTNCFASTSTTQPTHASLFTGLQPWDHGVTRNGVVLADGITTLAEHLRARGFSTHGIAASFPMHSLFGYAQGFDVYDDDFSVRYVQVWEGQRPESGAFYSLGSEVTEKALAAIDAAQGDRQFFWFHYFDPHDPYGDSATSAGDPGEVALIQRLLKAAARGTGVEEELRSARAGYDRDVRFLDASLARILERLAADEDRFRTHVLLTADHGESFGERLALGHGKRVTREQVQVPLVLLSPAVEPGIRTDLASTVDLARTLLSAAGLDAGDLGGRDLLAERDASAVVGMRRTFAGPKSEQLTDGKRRDLPESWFYLVRDGVLWSGNAERVLAEDDLTRPVVGAEADALRETFAALESLLEAGDVGEELLDPEVQERLRALGYTR